LRILIAALGILAGVAGLGIDFWIIVPPSFVAPEGGARSFPDALVYFWTFFTHLANLGLVLVYVSELAGWSWLGWFRKPTTRALMGGYILLVMLYYHFMLAPHLVFEGPLLVATILLHYVAPLLYLGWWAAHVPHVALRLADVPAMLAPGLIYVGWALLRGALVHEYPYDILDAAKYGYGRVAAGVGILMLAVALFCTLLVLADKGLARFGVTRARR